MPGRLAVVVDGSVLAELAREPKRLWLTPYAG